MLNRIVGLGDKTLIGISTAQIPGFQKASPEPLNKAFNPQLLICMLGLQLILVGSCFE